MLTVVVFYFTKFFFLVTVHICSRPSNTSPTHYRATLRCCCVVTIEWIFLYLFVLFADVTFSLFIIRLLSLSLSLSLQLRIWFIVRRRASFCRSFYFTRHYRVSPLVLFLCWCVVFCEMFDWKYAIQWTKSTTYTYTTTSKLLRLDRTQVYFRSQNFVVVWK